MADGLDTGIFVMGRERGLALIERLPEVGAVIVDRDGNVWVSSYLKGRVKIHEGQEKLLGCRPNNLFSPISQFIVLIDS